MSELQSMTIELINTLLHHVEIKGAASFPYRESTYLEEANEGFELAKLQLDLERVQNKYVSKVEPEIL